MARCTDDELGTVAIETENSFYGTKAYCEAKKTIFPWYANIAQGMKLCFRAKIDVRFRVFREEKPHHY